jgi:3-hydroxyisobutyrate dehydrogenase-like beta-hydroxyacid dehydrogenase
MLYQNLSMGFIGFGEVSYYFSRGLKEAGVYRIVAYDKATAEPVLGEFIRNRAQNAGVELAPTLEELVRSSDIVTSAVWGNVALEVTREAARFVGPGKIFADLNNTSPSVKKLGAEAINAKGAEFVDIGLFASPVQTGHKTFMYVCGNGAEKFKNIMSKYGMNIEVIPGEAGKATAIKTLANIHYKGIQALSLELLLTAHKAGIDPKLLEPLLVKPVALLPREKEMAFWVVRAGIHASRKTAELQDILDTMREWGIEPIMMEAARRRFSLIAQYDLKDYFKAGLPVEDYYKMFEAIEKIGKEKGIELSNR